MNKFQALAPAIALSLAVSAYIKDPIPQVEGIELQTPVAKEQVSEQVDSILMYCGLRSEGILQSEGRCSEKMDARGKMALYRYFEQSTWVKVRRILYEQCLDDYKHFQTFGELKSDNADLYAERNWSCEAFDLLTYEAAEYYARDNAIIVERNARAEYIQQKLDEGDAEMYDILERAEEFVYRFKVQGETVMDMEKTYFEMEQRMQEKMIQQWAEQYEIMHQEIKLRSSKRSFL